MEEAKKRINEWIKNNDPEQVLDLSCLGLKFLPDLPHNLKKFNCSSNQLTQLPDLPQCQTLYCYSNQLTQLPDLLHCQTLSCTYNQLTQLPDLPHCQRLSCSGNTYLYITKAIADKFHLKETPNYV